MDDEARSTTPPADGALVDVDTAVPRRADSRTADEATGDNTAEDTTATTETTGDEVAAEGSGPPEGSVVVPPLAGKVYYLAGGVLPKAYLPWVWHDLHDAGWRRRQAARPVLLVLPFAIVFALLPGQIGVRVTVVAFILVASAGLGIGLSNFFRNRRLVMHGFAPVKPVYVTDDFDEE